MTTEEYDKLVKEYLGEYQIKKVEDYQDIVRVDIIPRKTGWGICTFLFTDGAILCYGDVDSFTWATTWDAAREIKKGNCHADDFGYLSGKLQHRNELECLDMSEKHRQLLKEALLDDLTEFQTKKEIEEKWNENKYLLDKVDEHRMGKLDEFLEKMGAEDVYEYHTYVYDLPVHYYCAVAMLRCIENYFSKKSLEAKE